MNATAVDVDRLREALRSAARAKAEPGPLVQLGSTAIALLLPALAATYAIGCPFARAYAGAWALALTIHIAMPRVSRCVWAWRKEGQPK